MTTATQSIDPLARQLLEAIDEQRGAPREAPEPLSAAQARRVASRVAHGMLAASTLETAQHSDDVVVVSRAICDLLEIKGADRHDLLAAARLHDIGKVAVPAEILEKPGRLTAPEWELMRTHTVVGTEILSAVPELRGIASLVRSSHERWDGQGYPDGLTGNEIPPGSRIIFCADAFHAIRSDRPYRAGVPALEALAEVRRHAGTQFDPEVVEALASVARELRLVPAGGRVRRSSRLSALLMMLALGATGSAVAQSDLLGGGEPAGGGTVAPVASALCGPADCPALLGVSISDQLGLRPPTEGGAAPEVERGGAGGEAPGAPATAPTGTSAPGREHDRPGSGSPAPSGPQAAPGAPAAGDSGTGEGGSGGKPGHPQGGPPGQTGNHPQGGPPGQTGNHPQGGPPGQTGNHPQGGPPGQTGNHPQGGPPGQAGKTPK